MKQAEGKEQKQSNSIDNDGQSVLTDLWVEEHADILYRFALARIQNPTVAEDLVQETFVAALKSLKSYHNQSSLRTWLIGILKHKIIDHFRSQRKTISLEETDFSCQNADEESNLPRRQKVSVNEWNISPEKIVEELSFRETLQKCLDHLPEKAKQLFLMREIDEVESVELCKIFNVTTTNLWVMLYRIRNRLKSCLEKNWFNK